VSVPRCGRAEFEVEAGAFWDGEGASARVGAALNRRRAAGVGARTRAVMAGGAEGRLLRPAARRGAAKLLTRTGWQWMGTVSAARARARRHRVSSFLPRCFLCRAV